MEKIPFSQKIFSRVFFNSRFVWRGIGDIESALLYSKIDPIKIENPIFITSMARSGTTLLLNMISFSEDIATHKYKDFPFIFTPMIWSWLNNLFFKKETNTYERFHRDDVMVNRQSPEAMEEIIWSYFFPNSHKPKISSILNQDNVNGKFEIFFTMHLKKLLFLNSKTRYASKANYHIARIEYLHKLFPDAQFVVPFRNPVNQVYSLIKQHKLFEEFYSKDKFIKEYLGYAGHYEFGPDFRPSNFNNSEQSKEVIDLFNSGEYIEAYSKLWNETYGYLLKLLEDKPHLKSKVMLIDYDVLCHKPEESIGVMAETLNLHFSKVNKKQICEDITIPQYYSMNLSQIDKKCVQEITNTIYKQLKEKAAIQ